MGFIIFIEQDHGVVEIVCSHCFPEGHAFRLWHTGAIPIWRASLLVVMKVKDNVESRLICLLDSFIEELKKELLVCCINPIREWETQRVHMQGLAHLIKNSTIEHTGQAFFQISRIFPGISIRKSCFDLCALQYQRLSRGVNQMRPYNVRENGGTCCGRPALFKEERCCNHHNKQ